MYTVHIYIYTVLLMYLQDPPQLYTYSQQKHIQTFHFKQCFYYLLYCLARTKKGILPPFAQTAISLVDYHLPIWTVIFNNNWVNWLCQIKSRGRCDLGISKPAGLLKPQQKTPSDNRFRWTNWRFKSFPVGDSRCFRHWWMCCGFS